MRFTKYNRKKATIKALSKEINYINNTLGRIGGLARQTGKNTLFKRQIKLIKELYRKYPKEYLQEATLLGNEYIPIVVTGDGNVFASTHPIDIIAHKNKLNHDVVVLPTVCPYVRTSEVIDDK